MRYILLYWYYYSRVSLHVNNNIKNGNVIEVRVLEESDFEMEEGTKSSFMHLGAVDIIPEWLSFRNEFRSRMKFALHSYDKLHWRSRSRGFRARSVTRAQLAPRLHDLRFSIRNEVLFQFTWYQKEISHQNENFIRNENRNELIPGWLAREQNFLSESKYNREKYIEMEWTLSGMKVIPLSRE